MDQNLETVRETFLAKNQFRIPDYQRGYKWTVAEVRKLLEDVNGFKPGNGLDYYCLQNLTLVRSANNLNLLKVVDGQQRLITSLIIIAYLQHRQIDNLPHLPDGQLSFGTIQDGTAALEQNATEHKSKTRQETTQPFLSNWIITGQIWMDAANNDILSNPVWTSSGNCEKLEMNIHQLFDQWLKDKSRDIYNHSDIFHIFCAAMTIAVFFQGMDRTHICDFADRFLDKVKFLHNIVLEDATTAEGQAGVREAEIFSKINGFRVPLDGADLLRAIFITKAGDKIALGGGPTEHEVRLNEARLKLGLELDEIGAWWLDKRHRMYFAMFDPYKKQESSFDSERYPINNLYRLFAASRGEKHITLEWFEKQEILALYRDICHFHSVLKDWYEDVKIYHYAGFLVGQCREQFGEIYKLLTNSDNRLDLHKRLKSRIFSKLLKLKEIEEEGSEISNAQTDFSRESLKTITDAIVCSTHNWYDEELFSVKQTLTLMDVIAFAEPDCLMVNSPDDKSDESKKQKKEKKRTPLADHLDPEFFTCEGEDKEHIFPQTPIGGKDRNNSKQLYWKMQRYLKLVSKESKKDEKYLVSKWEEFWRECETRKQISDKQEVFPLTFENETEAKEKLQWLFKNEGREKETINRINAFVINQCKIDLNSIGNIVMLDAHINRGYGNDFFDEKRKEIWAKYRTCQPVRLHTYRVFAKEFPGEELDLKEWDQAAIKANREAIKNEIELFFHELFPKKEAVQ